MKRISTILCLGVMTIWALSFPVTALGQSDVDNEEHGSCGGSSSASDLPAFGADTNLWDAIAQKVIISDRAKVELFVMSQCPYGVMAEQTIAPILEEFGELIDFKLHFIARETPDVGFRSMHGQPEVEEDIRQVVMARYYPDRYFDYVVARADNYRSDDWEQLVADLGIDPEMVNEIASGAEGTALFRENIKKGNELGIGASPTLLIDDEKYTGRIFPLSAASAGLGINPETDAQEKITAYTSICADIGEIIMGTYTLQSVDVTTCEGLENCHWDLQGNTCRCTEWETVGPCNSGGCLGRCGMDCAGERPRSIQIFTQECFNHDLCTRFRPIGGPLDCADEWLAAADGYIGGPNCAEDPLVVVGHVSSGSGCNTNVPVTFKVKNIGPFYDTYNLEAVCAPWPCPAQPSSVGPIAPGTEQLVTVYVSIQAPCQGDECTGSVVLEATSQCNPNVSDFADGSFTLSECCTDADCDAKDGCYAYDNGCEYRDYYCSGGSCEYTFSNRHTDYYDDWVYYCVGDEVWRGRWLHDFRCEEGECVEHIVYHEWEDEFVETCSGEEWCECGTCVPVELSSFTATAGDGEVTLQWVTESETDNLGFCIYRSLSEDGEYERITGDLIEGAGSSSSKHEYTYTDQRLTNGVTYYYKLEDVDFAGNRTMHGPVSAMPVNPNLEPATQATTPDRYSLSQNSPNPFNLDTYIKFAMKESGHVRLSIYNALGRRIRVLVDAELAANEYTVHWDGRDDAGRLVASGNYIYGIECYTSTGSLNFMGGRKMVLLR